MKLRRLRIQRMPGIDQTFEIRLGVQGQNLSIVVGPNESGKSSICRAIAALLWPGIPVSDDFAAQSVWEEGGRQLFASREGRGTTRWQQEGQEVEGPALPPDHLAQAYRLGLQALVKARADETDESLAEEIRRRIAGGYDVEATAKRLFSLGVRHAHKEVIAMREAATRLDDERAQQARLAERERALASKRDEFQRADEARARRSLLGEVQRLGTARRHLEAVRHAFEEFPQGMEGLVGDEPERLSIARKEEVQAERELAESDAQIAQLRELIATCAVPEVCFSSEQHTEWSARAQAAVRLVDQLREAERSKDKAEAALRVAEESLGRKHPDDDSAEAAALASSTENAGASLRMPSVAMVEQIGELLGEIEALTATRQALERLLELLETGTQADDHALSEAIGALEDWLSVPWGAGRLRILLGALSLVMVASGGYLGATMHGAWYLLAGLGIVGLFGFMQLIYGERATISRVACRQRFEDSGLPVPSAWSPFVVKKCLHELRTRFAEVEGAAEARRRAREMEAERAALAEQLREKSALLRSLCQDAGLGFGERPLRAALLVQRLAAWQRAHEEFEAARAGHARLVAEQQEAMETLGAFLAAHGKERPSDPLAAQRAIAELLGSIHQAQSARDQISVREQARALQSISLARARERCRKTFEAAGLKDGQDGELARRLGELAAYREAVGELRKAESAVAHREQELSAHAGRLSSAPEQLVSELLALSPAELDAECAQVEAIAARRDDLLREIEAIEQQVRQAREGHALADAQVTWNEAAEELAARRDELLFCSAGEFLLERVRERHDRENEPAVLAEARRLFELFTQGRYGLSVGRDTSRSEFRAVDRDSGRTLLIEQLSDGTRAQLLLAVRVAFIVRAETGIHVPLMLDESLTAMDPVRSRAIIEGLVRASDAQDRQLLYFTCEPGEISRWNELLVELGHPPAELLDLAEIRALAAAAPSTMAYSLARPTVVPPPGDLSAEEYAQLIRVPRWDPRIHPGGVPLYYLLSEDLATLQALLSCGVLTAGRYRALRASGGLDELISAEACASIDRELLLVEAFLEAYQQGRGRPVDRGVLERSGAVSNKFIGPVAELMRHSGGDAVEIIAALRARKVPRFLESKILQLEDELAKAGYLDVRTRLDFDEVQQRVVSFVRAHVLPKPPVEELAARVHVLWELSEQAQSCVRSEA